MPLLSNKKTTRAPPGAQPDLLSQGDLLHELDAGALLAVDGVLVLLLGGRFFFLGERFFAEAATHEGGEIGSLWGERFIN